MPAPPDDVTDDVPVVRQYPIRALERNLIQPVIRENSSHLHFSVSGQGKGARDGRDLVPYLCHESAAQDGTGIWVMETQRNNNFLE